MLRNSVEFSQRWKSYLEEVGIQSKAVFIQIVTSGLLGQLISDIYVAKCVQYKNIEVQFTFEEENTIRYMAGYIVQKIHKKFGTKDVEMLIESDKTTIMDTNSTEWVNRGGLVHVTSCSRL